MHVTGLVNQRRFEAKRMLISISTAQVRGVLRDYNYVTSKAVSRDDTFKFVMW